MLAIISYELSEKHDIQEILMQIYAFKVTQ